MKIGIVCYPTFGGSGVVATELGIELSKKGYEIHFITYNQPVKLELLSNKVHYHEVMVPDYPLFHYQPYELALSTKVVDMVKKHEIELLHVHYAIPHAYAAYMAKNMLKYEGINIPVVTTLHGTDITLVGSHPSYKAAVEFSINKSDAVTAVSESLKKDTEELFSIDTNIEVIPNFINLEKYPLERKEKTRREEEQRRTKEKKRQREEEELYYIIIIIDDDGPGIAENEYENVFKPFYKIDKGRGDSKSSVGLGLSITSDIIKSHGGNIILEKSHLNGLRVKIFLPL